MAITLGSKYANNTYIGTNIYKYYLHWAIWILGVLLFWYYEICNVSEVEPCQALHGLPADLVGDLLWGLRGSSGFRVKGFRF